MPSTLGLILLANPLLTTLFGYGEFTRHDVEMASLSLIAYALAITPFILIKVLAPGFYARQDTTTPMRIGVKALVVKMLLSVAIVVPMVINDIPAPHAGLAAATALFAWIHLTMLYRGLRRHGFYVPTENWGRYLSTIALALLAMCVVLVALAKPTEFWPPLSFWQRGLQLLGIISATAAAYLAILWLRGLRPHQFRT